MDCDVRLDKNGNFILSSIYTAIIVRKDGYKFSTYLRLRSKDSTSSNANVTVTQNHWSR